MKFYSLFAATLLIAGCASNSNSVVDTEGPRSPLANPADNTLNSATTGPSSAGLPNGPESAGTAAPGPLPTNIGHR